MTQDCSNNNAFYFTEWVKTQEKIIAKEHKKKTLRFLLKSWIAVILLGVASYIFFTTIIQISIIPSNSMEPAIMRYSFVSGDRKAKEDVKKGDVIIFERENVSLIKRIIAKEGDTVKLKKGVVYINGKKESRGLHKGKTLPGEDGKKTYKVPKGCFFVLGDNREHSKDSRSFKDPFVKKEEVTSKACVILPTGDVK